MAMFSLLLTLSMHWVCPLHVSADGSEISLKIEQTLQVPSAWQQFKYKFQFQLDAQSQGKSLLQGTNIYLTCLMVWYV